METTMTSEEGTESDTESSGALILDGEAWKNRDETTYTSLLDMYGVSDLFSSSNTELYGRQRSEDKLKYQEMTEYLFTGQINEKKEETIAEQIFSEEIQLSKTRDYNKKDSDYTVCFVMGEILFVLVFICIWIRIDAARKKRRKEHAAEINMEN